MFCCRCGRCCDRCCQCRCNCHRCRCRSSLLLLAVVLPIDFCSMLRLRGSTHNRPVGADICKAARKTSADEVACVDGIIQRLLGQVRGNHAELHQKRRIANASQKRSVASASGRVSATVASSRSVTPNATPPPQTVACLPTVASSQSVTPNATPPRRRVASSPSVCSEMTPPPQITIDVAKAPSAQATADVDSSAKASAHPPEPVAPSHCEAGAGECGECKWQSFSATWQKVFPWLRSSGTRLASAACHAIRVDSVVRSATSLCEHPKRCRSRTSRSTPCWRVTSLRAHASLRSSWSP